MMGLHLGKTQLQCVKCNDICSNYVCMSVTEPQVACLQYVTYLTTLIRCYCVRRNCPATAQTMARRGLGKVVQRGLYFEGGKNSRCFEPSVLLEAGLLSTVKARAVSVSLWPQGVSHCRSCRLITLQQEIKPAKLRSSCLHSLPGPGSTVAILPTWRSNPTISSYMNRYS
jgi:hypothetical protein